MSSSSSSFPQSDRASTIRIAASAALLLGAALACNDHALAPFSASVDSGLTQVGPAWTRPVDVLFVVDNSGSMCEEQAILRRNFTRFVDILTGANADFRLAVVTTDVVSEPAGRSYFQRGPGAFGGSGDTCAAEVDLSDCPVDLPPFLDVGAYEAAGASHEDLARDFGCIAMAGTQGIGIEMGLGAVRAGLEEDARRPAGKRFVREDAFLAIVVLSDENDCSDGTALDGYPSPGPALAAFESGDGGVACELLRNVEDSCLFSADDPGPMLEHAGESRSAWDWCRSGERAAVEALADAIAPACPDGGCANALMPRTELYEYLSELKGGPENVFFGAIINADGGVRAASAADVGQWCGIGTQGYRYQLMAEMFGERRSLVTPICDLETQGPVDFADNLEEIATIIRDELSGVCALAFPMTCTADGPTDGACPAGEVCCPGGQRCDQGPFRVPGTLDTYRVCDGFVVDVAIRPDGADAFQPLEMGTSVTIDFESTQCQERTQVPLRVDIGIVPRPGDEISLSYPRAVIPELFEAP